jgi:hypothetical protein
MDLFARASSSSFHYLKYNTQRERERERVGGKAKRDLVDIGPADCCTKKKSGNPPSN